MSNQNAPLISVTLGLDPTSITESEAMELSVTAVSHASYQITILDYWTIFNVGFAQSLRRSSGNFHLHDIDTNTELDLQDIGCKKRGAIRYELDHSDSQYFHTLHPDIPYKFSGPCHVSHMELVPDHRYRLSVGEEEKVGWWKEGTKEDVLQSPGNKLLEYPPKSSGDPIIIRNIAPIDFTVPSDWKNIAASVGSDVSGMVGAMSRGTSTPPTITATMSVSSQLSENLAMELSITALSKASTPITIWTWPTILCTNKLQRSEKGSCAYTLIHLDTDTPVPTQEMFQTKQQGVVHREDRYFHTLQPGQPYKFSGLFTPTFTRELESRPGRYRLALKDSIKLKWWKEGTREETVTPLGQKPADDMYVASGEPIVVTDIEPIEFTITVDK